jgi:(S)-2-hydroxy-acid oxidase
MAAAGRCAGRSVERRAVFCLSDFEKYARTQLDGNVWGYYSSGADQELTLRDNEQAFRRYRLRPRMLRDVSKVDIKTRILGQDVSFPVCVGATAMQRMAHTDGEIATCRAAQKMGTCMMLSSWSTTSLEEVADTSGEMGLRWFQLYVYRDRDLTRNLVLRAERSGYKAIVVTVDAPVVAKRLADARNRFSLPPHLHLANFNTQLPQSSLTSDCALEGSSLEKYTRDLLDASLTWEGVDWIQGLTGLPVLVKGILTAEDAVEAVRHGVQGIIVSNHGGRQLDGVLATIDALSEVVKAVEGRVEVYMDGGVRQGTDVLKALAMGARAVFIGRPVLWGLAYNGQEGVESVLQILRDEFKTAMMLSGTAKHCSLANTNAFL